MKKQIVSILALCISTVFAADVVEVRTTTSTGTISEYTPGSRFIIKETSGPMSYRYGKTVTYVTKSGKVLTDADVKTRIRIGAPVSVQYITDGDERVISRVVVDDDDSTTTTTTTRPAPVEVTKKTTTTTTTNSDGLLHEYTPGKTFVVKETAGPMTYRYGKTVTYVTKSGKTLTEDDVKTRIRVGVPVRVQFGLEGETRVVNRVEIDD